jgi:hypothetical protein
LPTAENVLSEDKSKVKITSTQPITQGVSGFYGIFDPSTYIAVSGSYSVQDMMRFSVVDPFMYGLGERQRNQWVARQAGYWHVAANWSLGHVPTSSEDAVFTREFINMCSINGDVGVRDIIIEDGCAITITTGTGIVINARRIDLGNRSNVNFNDCTVNVLDGINTNSERDIERYARERRRVFGIF